MIRDLTLSKLLGVIIAAIKDKGGPLSNDPTVCQQCGTIGVRYGSVGPNEDCWKCINCGHAWVIPKDDEDGTGVCAKL